MITIGWMFFTIAILASVLNGWYAAHRGIYNSASECAVDAVLQSFLAVWIYLVLS